MGKLGWQHLLDSMNELSDKQFAALREAGLTKDEINELDNAWLEGHKAWVFPDMKNTPMSAVQYRTLMNYGVNFDDGNLANVTFLDARNVLGRLLAANSHSDPRYRDVVQERFIAAKTRKLEL